MIIQQKVDSKTNKNSVIKLKYTKNKITFFNTHLTTSLELYLKILRFLITEVE